LCNGGDGMNKRGDQDGIFEAIIGTSPRSNAAEGTRITDTISHQTRCPTSRLGIVNCSAVWPPNGAQPQHHLGISLRSAHRNANQITVKIDTPFQDR
jgi:hypothetical protein